MKRKLNIKNKVFISVFVLIVCGIIGLLIAATNISKEKQTTISYDIVSNSAIFDIDTNSIDTSNGGTIERRFNKEFYYKNNEGFIKELGKHAVAYDKFNNMIRVFGDNYQVFASGNVIENKNYNEIIDYETPSFYKLQDRLYLVVADEIYNLNHSIYTNKYLIIYLDKQGNASVVNDAINVKTINPMQLSFGDYTFDIANEKLIVNNGQIDLKLINGSTNEYVAKNPTDTRDEINEIVDSYNNLVDNFETYASNHTLSVSSSNQISNNYFISDSANTAGETVKNNIEIMKRVSLRGLVAHPTYVDVTYMVTDPEEKYQAVYLLVTGMIDGVYSTEKIMLDKYAINHRIYGLEPHNEYSISLGYTEIKNENGERVISNDIEDVVNIRTGKIEASIRVEKVAGGYVYYAVKMSNEYAFESGKITLYTEDGTAISSQEIDCGAALSESGFRGYLTLPNASLYELALEDTIYGGETVESGISHKFVLSGN